ncbi:MAG: hypothetical protein JXR19_02760 [Bacteroidia bacterium]
MLLRLGLIPLLFFFFFTHFEYRNELPRGVHQWAQADRYAIAARYMEDRSFWEPASYSVISDDGEVGVEMPLIQYVSGKLAYWTKSQNKLAFFYRFLSFLILFIGFYRLLERRLKKQKWWVKMAVAILFYSSPILLFYGFNFSPDALSLGLILLGMSFLDQKTDKVNWPLITSFGLAAAIKTSSGIYLIGYAAFLLWTHRKKLNKPVVTSLGLIAFIGALLAYYAKSQIINRNEELWSTLFLASTNPISNTGDFLHMLKGLWYWKYEYLNGIQWSISILIVLYVLVVKRSFKYTNIKLLYTIWFIGIVAILWLFGNQFVNHDYYALATFMPLLIIGLLQLTNRINWNRWVPAVVLILTGIVSFSYGSNQHFDRMSETCVINKQAMNFDFEWMRNLKNGIDNTVDESEKVFVVYGMEPNLSLVYLQRKGIVFNHEEMGREESNFYYWLERRQPEYVLCRVKYFELFKSEHNEFVGKSELLINHPEFVLLKTNGH